MAEPFVFRKVLYLVEASGRTASCLDELLRLVTLADPDAIGFHMHREFLVYKFAHAEWPNDFAYFTARILGDEILGERLANIRVMKHATLADVKLEISRVIADHLMRYPARAAERSPWGREFPLCRARKIILGTGRTAKDLSEFTGAIAEIESSSLFFHLFETRYHGARESSNDFAGWAEKSLMRPDLAARLSSIDPYMFSLEQARRVLLRVLTAAEEVSPV